jgi:extracellular matrix regulatory protein A
MATELIHIGFGNYVSASHMIGVAAPGSAPVKRLIHEGRGKGQTIDMTGGRRTKAVVFMENGAVVLSAITPETIEGRVRTHRVRPVDEEGE